MTNTLNSKHPYPTISATLDCGITIIVPAELPSIERCDQLVALYQEHVRPVKRGDHWKAACFAVVPADLADDVAESMNHMGSIVDRRNTLADGRVRLESDGYWAHGF